LYGWVVVDYILRKAVEETGIGYTLVKGGQKGRIASRRSVLEEEVKLSEKYVQGKGATLICTCIKI
jgi:hypothetical protein